MKPKTQLLTRKELLLESARNICLASNLFEETSDVLVKTSLINNLLCAYLYTHFDVNIIYIDRELEYWEEQEHDDDVRDTKTYVKFDLAMMSSFDIKRKLLEIPFIKFSEDHDYVYLLYINDKIHSCKLSPYDLSDFLEFINSNENEIMTLGHALRHEFVTQEDLKGLTESVGEFGENLDNWLLFLDGKTINILGENGEIRNFTYNNDLYKLLPAVEISFDEEAIFSFVKKTIGENSGNTRVIKTC